MSGPTDDDSSTGPPEEATLPPYTSHPPTSTPKMVTHTYSLVHKKGHNWLTLNVQSRASSPDQFPAVIGDRPVQGNVVYDPKDQKDPKSITVKILGELVSESNIHFTFLEVSQELWPAPATHDSGGPYTLPFSLQLPPTTEALNEEDKIETFKIPPTDFARIRRFTVVYTLQVKVKYSSMFRSTRMLDTSVNYTPLVQPPPPSVLRQNAYSANSPIPAPDADPEGWHSLPSLTFEGKLFNDRVITFKYTLSLAKPVRYKQAISPRLSIHM
ncbi:hypothetical protein BC629DRAFT_1538465 [Irpex lacteus]|nr:hypothetical protein BC629DRAFT_1538465 [Irpex lacteus]